MVKAGKNYINTNNGKTKLAKIQNKNSKTKQKTKQKNKLTTVKTTGTKRI